MIKKNMATRQLFEPVTGLLRLEDRYWARYFVGLLRACHNEPVTGS